MQFEESGRHDVIVQFSPGFIHKQAQLKGGRSEKYNNLWLDIWEQIASLADGNVEVAPETTALTDPRAILQLINWLTENRANPGDVAYDYETWGDVDARRPELCREFKIVSIGLAWLGDDGNIANAGFLFDRPTKASTILEAAWVRFLTVAGRTAHNARFEHKVNLHRFGFTSSLRCTMLQRHTLDELADGSLDRVMRACGANWGGFKKEMEGIRTDPMRAPVDKLLRYNPLDAHGTKFCEDTHAVLLEEAGLEAVARQNEEFSYYLALQEMKGLKVNQVEVATMRAKLTADSQRLQTEFRKLPAVRKTEQWAKLNIKSCKNVADVVFNPASTPMMRHFILDELKIKVPVTKKQGKESLSLNQKVLEKFEGRFPELTAMNEYRSAQSMAIFLQKWDAFIGPKGCVHSSYSQNDVVTGRLSSTNPPLQNIPKEHEIRRVFESRFPKGWMINGDYRQQEPRLIAGWSGDQKMIKAIMSGLNLHAFVGQEIFDVPYEEIMANKAGKEYDVGKKMNLGIAYGQTEYGLSQKTGMSIERAQELLAKYDRMFPEITAWRQGFHRQAIHYGYVEDLFGARRHLPGAQSSDKWARERALRQAGNFPVQGSAYRFTQIAVGVLTELFESELPGKAFVVGQVHDSIIADCEADVKDRACELMVVAMKVHNHMDYWRDRGVPMEADLKVGRNLFEMEEWEQS